MLVSIPTQYLSNASDYFNLPFFVSQLFTITLILSKAFSSLTHALLSDIPGRPEISGVPAERVRPGALVRLSCRSLGTSNETQLVWYNNGERVDDSYYISTDFVINGYELVTPRTGISSLECRLSYPPTGLEQLTEADIRVQGSIMFSLM